MKLKYIFLVLFGIIIFLILNNIDTFNIGIPYKFIPPVDTPIPQELSEMAVTEWDTREEAKAVLAQWIDDVDGNIDDNIIFKEYDLNRIHPKLFLMKTYSGLSKRANIIKGLSCLAKGFGLKRT